MKKTVTVIIIVLLLAVLLIPVPQRLKDGGTVRYKALTYCVTKEHSLAMEEEIEKTGRMYHEGTIVEIFGMKVFDNVE